MTLENHFEKAQVRKEKSEKRKNEAFHNFLDAPLTRMGISSLGEAGKNESFNLLLSAAFDAGFGAGGADIAIDMAEALMEGMKKDRPPRAA